MYRSPCEGLTPEQAAFCRAGTQPFISQQALQYREHREKCNWHTEPAGAFDIDSMFCRNFTEYGHMIAHMSKPDLRVCERKVPELVSCSLSDWEDPSAEWRILRAGPFTSHGGAGYDWTELTMNDVLKGLVASEHTADGRFYLTASNMGPILEDGTPLSSPPLHVHHAHLTTSFQSPMRARAPTGEQSANYQNAFDFWSQGLHIDDFTFHVHGDSPCLSSQGGVDCYMLSLPDGFGYQPPRGAPIFFNIEINDVRRAGSPPITWWIETGFRWSRAPKRRVAKFFFSGSHNACILTCACILICACIRCTKWHVHCVWCRFFFSGALGLHMPAVLPSSEERSDLGGWLFRLNHQIHMATWMIPDADSIWWSSTPMHTSGVFAHYGLGLSHSHQPYSKGYWVIQGTPEQAGLHDKRFDQCTSDAKGLLSHIGVPMLFVLEEHGLTIDEVKHHVNSSVRASADRCAREGCHVTPKVRCTAGTGLEYYEAAADGIDAGWYDVMPATECDLRGWTFDRGDVITALYFMGRVHPQDTHVESPFPMHATIGAYVVENEVPWTEDEYVMNFRYHNPWTDPSTAFNYYFLGGVINASI